MTAHEAMIPRRGLLIGAGAAAAGIGLLANLPSAGAAPGSPEVADAAGRNRVVPAATNEPAPIGSAPNGRYTYRFASFFDFTPESPSDTRAWGGYGCYTTAGGAMWASMDIPSGARIKDIEWYVYNSTSTALTGLGRIWTAGLGSLYTPTADVPIPVNSELSAYNAEVPSANYGPYRLGSRLYLGMYTTDKTGKAQVNGVRVGFDSGGADVGLINVPVRAYDSRTLHDPFGAGATRTITLPNSAVFSGTTGVMIMVTAINPKATGRLVVWSANSSAPTMAAVNYTTGQTVGNSILVGVSSTRQIKILSTAAADVTVDVMGIIS